MGSSINRNEMIIKGSPVDAERSRKGARVCAGKDVGGLFIDRSTERTIRGGVVMAGVKLAADTGAPSEELPPPTAFCWGETCNCLS